MKTTNTKRTYLALGGLAVLLAAAIPVGYFAGRARAAGIPATAGLTYSGVLSDPSGTPLTGAMNIQLSVFDAATAGNQVCSTAPSSQTLVGGAFQITLPDTCTAAVRANPDLWIEIFVAGASVGRTKLSAVPYAVTAAEVSCGPVGGPAMIDTGAGFCIDAADRGAETAYASSITSCAMEGKTVCSLVQLCTAKVRNIGNLGTAAYRVSDLMFYTPDTSSYFGGGSGGQALHMPAGCSITAPGPNGGPTNFRCCRSKG